MFCLLAWNYIFMNPFWPWNDKWGSQVYPFLVGQILVVVESCCGIKWLTQSSLAASLCSHGRFSGKRWRLLKDQQMTEICQNRKEGKSRKWFPSEQSPCPSILQLSEWSVYSHCCFQLRDTPSWDLRGTPEISFPQGFFQPIYSSSSPQHGSLVEWQPQHCGGSAQITRGHSPFCFEKTKKKEMLSEGYWTIWTVSNWL